MKLIAAIFLTLIVSLSIAKDEAPSTSSTSAEKTDLGEWKLLDDPNLAQNVGIWDSKFYVRDRSGELIKQYDARKNIQVYDNIFYQINTYTFEDGRVQELRFVGAPRKSDGFETDSPDRKYFKRLQRVGTSMGPHIAIWTLRDGRTGQDLGAEFITTFGDKRTATPHFYEIPAARRKELGIRADDPPSGLDATTTIIEQRIAPMISDEPLFSLTEEEKRGLLPIFHAAFGIDQTEPGTSSRKC